MAMIPPPGRVPRSSILAIPDVVKAIVDFKDDPETAGGTSGAQPGGETRRNDESQNWRVGKN